MNKELAKRLPLIPDGFKWKVTPDIYPPGVIVALLNDIDEVVGNEDSGATQEAVVRHAESILQEYRTQQDLIGVYPARLLGLA